MMFDAFFLNSHDLSYPIYNSSYNMLMVVASVLIAIFASFCAFEMVERLANTTQRSVWLPIGSVILGAGVWAMHFVGMLAFRLDCEVTYDLLNTSLSMLPGIFAAAVTLNIIASEAPSFSKLVLGGIVIALGIAMMHFTGMSAIRLDGILRYEPILFFSSLITAVSFAVMALLTKPLLVKLKLNTLPFVSSLIGGSVMGGAISGMHYIAMQAAYFIHDHPDGNQQVIVATSPAVLAMTVVAVAILLIFSGLLFTYLGSKIVNARQHIEAILATTSQGFVMIDRCGMVTECNDAMSVLTGISQRALVGKPYGDLITSDNRVPLQEGNYQIEVAIRRPDGSLLSCLVHGNAVTDEHGALLYSFALFSDITARKEAEYSLIRSETKFRTLYDSTSEAVMLLGEEGFFDCNKATLVLFGCATKAEFCSKHPADFSPPTQHNDRDSVICTNEMINKAMENGSHRFEWLHQRADNNKVFSAEVALSVMQLNGKSIVLATVHDITERKQYEEKLLQLAEAQNQLLQSEKMATIGQLAAGVAHELNNPIAFVNSNLGTLEGYLKDILEVTALCQSAANPAELAKINEIKAGMDFEYLKSDVFQLVAESRDGLSRMKNIVQNLKDFSRVGESEWQLADLHQCLNSTLNIVWNDLKYKCTVTKHYADDLPQICCLASQLNQVFMNLLVNAGHAIETRGEITITTRPCPTDSSSVQILIADTGIGIPPENIKRIFDPFFTTKPVGKGTGLGLSIAWGIIAKHHGALDIDSNEGAGSTFTITLPINHHV